MVVNCDVMPCDATSRPAHGACDWVRLALASDVNGAHSVEAWKHAWLHERGIAVRTPLQLGGKVLRYIHQSQHKK
jgi:hypothetical protein